MTYRYVATSAVTTAVISADLPLVATNFTEVMNGSGQLTGTIPIGDPSIDAQTAIWATQPWQSAIWVYRDEALIWGGPVVQRTYKEAQSAQNLTITVNDWWIYFSKRHVWDHTFTNVDQMQIVNALLDDAMSSYVPTGLRWDAPPWLIVPTPANCGQLMSVTYQGSQNRMVSDAINELANQAPPLGFEWTIDLADNGGIPLSATVNLWYPSRDAIPGL